MQNFKLRHTLRPAAFKLTADTTRHTDPAQMDAPSLTHVVCGRNDSADFQLLVSAEDAFTLTLDAHPYFSQNNALPTVRVTLDAPFSAELSHIDLNIINDGTKAIPHKAIAIAKIVSKG